MRSHTRVFINGQINASHLRLGFPRSLPFLELFGPFNVKTLIICLNKIQEATISFCTSDPLNSVMTSLLMSRNIQYIEFLKSSFSRAEDYSSSLVAR